MKRFYSCHKTDKKQYEDKIVQKPTQLLVYFCLPEEKVTNEETNAGDGVTHAIDETDTDESKHEKRKSRAKSVTLKDNALTRSNSGKLLI